MYQATLKVGGGKLLRVKMELENVEENLKIGSLNLTGDFFLHPEDTLPELEKALCGLDWPAEEKVYVDGVEGVLNRNGAKFIGVSAQDIAQAILMAVEEV